MSDTHKCAWCGHTFEKSGGSKFLSGATLGFSDFGKKYCSKACEHAAKEAKNPEGPKGSSNENNFTPGANQSGGTTIINKGDGFFTTAAKGLFGNSEETKKIMDMESEEISRKNIQLDEITSMKFGSDVDEISNQLSQLSTLGKTKPDKKIKNAIIEKMEFGIMKLRNLNANSEADFFQKKLSQL